MRREHVLVDKAKDLGKVSAKGGFNLFWGIALSSVITALGIILIGRDLTGEQMGLVSIVLIAPNLIKTFRDLGVDQATIKYVAQYRAEDKLDKVKQIIASEVLFELLVGFVLFACSFLLSGFFAQIYDRPEITGLIQIASIIIFAEALMKAAQSAFTGYEKMGLYSAMLVVQSGVKTGLMVLLVKLGYGVYGATLGDATSYLVAGALGMIGLYFAVYRGLHKFSGPLQIISTLKSMFRYGIPVSIAWTINAFLTQFYSTLLAIYSSDLIMGNYFIALSFSVILTFFVVPLNTILFPAFSKINQQTESELLKIVFRSSVKYATLIVAPATLAVMVLAQPAIYTLFGDKFEFTPLYVALYVAIYLYTAIGSLSAGNVINSQGRTEVNLKLTLITAAMGLSLSLILIPLFGVIGLLATYLVAGIPSTFLALWWINKHYNASIDYLSSAKILSASTASAAVTFLVISQLQQASWINLILGAVVFVAVFLFMAPLFRAINRTDIQYLKETINALGPLSKILNIPFTILEKLTNIFQPSNK
ncbi:MAG: oligosaccharide flippase family protein [Candidatus Bathyarchaeota archaeon]|nr:oligosaccharide flippase family protein [Candidatus Bathyarchaeum tardum]